MYFQQGTYSINSGIKDKEHEAGSEMGFKVMNKNSVLIVGLCQLKLLLVALKNPASIQFFSSAAS